MRMYRVGFVGRRVSALASGALSSVALALMQSCSTLCDPKHSRLSVLQYLPDLAQILSVESMMPSDHLVLCRRLSCPQAFPASGSIPMNRLFASGGRSIGQQAQW